MPITLSNILILLVSLAIQIPENIQTIFDGAITNFLAGRVKESTVGFDEVARLRPDIAPQLWQRGIALYYTGRYQDCREQFESHRTVNPADVENAVWHFLCVARLESPEEARTALLPVGLDRRSPMPEIYEMFRGTMTPEKMMESATDGAASRFYSHLYLGLYYEAFGDQQRALEHIRTAVENRSALGYMHTVAQIHLEVLERPE